VLAAPWFTFSSATSSPCSEGGAADLSTKRSLLSDDFQPPRPRQPRRLFLCLVSKRAGVMTGESFATYNRRMRCAFVLALAFGLLIAPLSAADFKLDHVTVAGSDIK